MEGFDGLDSQGWESFVSHDEDLSYSDNAKGYYPGFPLTERATSASSSQKPRLQNLFLFPPSIHDPSQTQCSFNSESSCATFSTVASPNAEESSLNSPENSDYLLDSSQHASSKAENGNTVSTEKPSAIFQCDRCMKRYTRVSNLRAHRRTHYRRDMRTYHEYLHSDDNIYRRRKSMGGISKNTSSEFSLSSATSCDTFSSLSSEDFDFERGASLGPAASADGDLYSFHQCKDNRRGDYNMQMDNSGIPAILGTKENGPIVPQGTPSSHISQWYDENFEWSLIADINPEEPLLIQSEDDHKAQTAPLDNSLVHSYIISSSGVIPSNKGQYTAQGSLRLLETPQLNSVLKFEVDRGHRSSVQSAYQPRIKELDKVQPPPIDDLNVRKRLEEVNGVKEDDVNAENDEDTKTAVAKCDDSTCLTQDLISGQTCSPRPSPTRSFTMITFGKASPYSVHSQDVESDSCHEVETELSDDDDDHSSVQSPCPSLLNSGSRATKQKLIVEILGAFWDIYNRDFTSIVSQCITLMTTGITTGSNFNDVGSSQSSSSASASSNLSTLLSSSAKRKISEDDFPTDGSGQGPTQPNGGTTLMPVAKLAVRYACPFRKHNPRKYNMYQHQQCALGSFGSIARTKEHLYRRHTAPIQCIRCWLFFKDQDKLNIHMLATNICERRDGQLAEGITPSMEKRLRSRKKSPEDQTEEDRWRSIYRMLFPDDEDVPSPYYETVQDDLAQTSESLVVSMEEYMRQEVPEIFSQRLQNEVDNMFLEDTGLLDDTACLRQTFIARMTSLISDAQQAAVQAYRQRSSGNTSQSNHLMTPGPSSSSGSFQSTQEELRIISLQFEHDSKPAIQVAVTPWPQELQSADLMVSTSDLDIIQGYPVTQMEQGGDVLCREEGNHLKPLDYLIQRHEFKSSDNYTSPREKDVGGESCSSVQNFQQHYLPSGNDSQLELELNPEYDWAIWGDIQS